MQSDQLDCNAKLLIGLRDNMIYKLVNSWRHGYGHLIASSKWLQFR